MLSIFSYAFSPSHIFSEISVKTTLYWAVLFLIVLRVIYREFPGGLLVRILGFNCCGPGSIPGRGPETLQVMQCCQKINK